MSRKSTAGKGKGPQRQEGIVAFRVPIDGIDYRVLDLAKPIVVDGERFDMQVDFQNRTLRVSPDLSPNRRAKAIAIAVAQAWQEAPRFIAGRRYGVRIVRGRLFFNRDEYKCLVDHDDREIRVSDLVPMREQQALINEAVSSTRRMLMDEAPMRR